MADKETALGDEYLKEPSSEAQVSWDDDLVAVGEVDVAVCSRVLFELNIGGNI